MRLIDADSINPADVIGGASEFATDIRKAMQDLIDSQPTAYDPDKEAQKIIIVNSSNEKESVSVGDFVIYKCPNCGKKIGSAFHYPPNEHMMEHKFCDGCGQKFDWRWE